MGWVNPREAQLRSLRLNFLFVDELGKVEVVGCRTLRVTGIWPFKGVERWELEPQHLIFDGNGETWSNASEVVSYVPMLRDWMSEKEQLIDWDFGDDNTWLEIKLKKPKRVPLCGRLKHQIVLAARTNSTERCEGRQAFSIARIVTSLEDPEDRDVAFEEHSAILDFLSIIYGQPVGFSERFIKSSKNPILNFNEQGAVAGSWVECRVETPGCESGLLETESITKPEAILLYFPENTEVFSRWLEFWANNKPGVDALIRALSEESSWENRLLNVAVAVEDFGYKIPGKTEQGTVDNCFPVYLKRICLSMPRITLMHPEPWARRFNSAYKGIKHADNEYPELIEIARTAYQGINWLRAWCCFQVDPDNPIMLDTWRRLNNLEEFRRGSQDELAKDDWSRLLTDEQWKQEGERLPKAKTRLR